MTLDRRRAIAWAFAQAAGEYDAHADVQRAVAAELARHIAAVVPPAPRVLEIGCGTGMLTSALSRQLPGARIVATDLAPAMVQAAAGHVQPLHVCFAAMDGLRPCFRPASFDLVCASLVFQWFEDLPAALAVLQDLLAPGGLLAFATLGPGSFAEWHQAHRLAGVSPPLHAYPSAQAIAAAWPGPACWHHETRVVAHHRGLDFLRTLRGLGAVIPGSGQPRLGAGTLRRVLACFEAEGGATARYEVIYALLSRG